MGLSKKTFFYSMALAVVMVAFVVGYFVFMLPSLYVDYVMESNLDSVVDIQKGYRQSRTYEDLSVKNPSAVYSLEIPKEGREFYLAGKFFKMTVKVRDEELQGLFDRMRAMVKGIESLKEEEIREYKEEDFFHIWKELKEKFSEKDLFSEDFPVEIQVEAKGGDGVYREEYFKFHRISDDLFVYEAGVSDGNFSYTTYIAMGQEEDAYIFTVLPTMTPRMEEITPVVMGSLPMIIAVVFLLVLLSSHYFSGKIVKPIIRLADYAESAKQMEGFDSHGFVSDSHDEIGALGETLNELYEKLHASYRELEGKNRMLEEKNQRQEVFLRAASHQLKTPIAAALLLVEGMRNEIGKYKDVKAYLPEVKKQLLSMQKIVEDMLQLNYQAENREREMVSVDELVRETLKSYGVQTEAKRFAVEFKGSGTALTDRELMKKVIDNLISNGVQYTPEGERIEIEVEGGNLRIRNYGVVIEEKLLPNIFEPFVSSMDGRGKGLGLYVAAYYSKILGLELTVENIENGVQSVLKFKSEQEIMEI